MRCQSSWEHREEESVGHTIYIKTLEQGEQRTTVRINGSEEDSVSWALLQEVTLTTSMADYIALMFHLWGVAHCCAILIKSQTGFTLNFVCANLCGCLCANDTAQQMLKMHCFTENRDDTIFSLEC